MYLVYIFVMNIIMWSNFLEQWIYLELLDCKQNVPNSVMNVFCL